MKPEIFSLIGVISIFQADGCGLDIPLIRLANANDFEAIQNPETHFYTFDTFSAKVDRASKVSPGVVGNFDINYNSDVLSASIAWSGKELHQKMAAVFGSEFSAAEVEKLGNCKNGYSYRIKWDTAGDKPSIGLNFLEQ